ncbi:MAG: hypothetical protein R6V72_08695 [Cyclobacterium sp.]|uniref:hypothetical protein n=1 Tax=unclassified Cyclobacterium TaxID=2615055 RepID=UPI0013D24FA3|nr:hypothetical protein [Cyclobacterium sp. SYSU L10401]
MKNLVLVHVYENNGFVPDELAFVRQPFAHPAVLPLSHGMGQKSQDNQTIHIGALLWTDLWIF